MRIDRQLWRMLLIAATASFLFLSAKPSLAESFGIGGVGLSGPSGFVPVTTTGPITQTQGSPPSSPVESANFGANGSGTASANLAFGSEGQIIGVGAYASSAGYGSVAAVASIYDTFTYAGGCTGCTVSLVMNYDGAITQTAGGFNDPSGGVGDETLAYGQFGADINNEGEPIQSAPLGYLPSNVADSVSCVLGGNLSDSDYAPFVNDCNAGGFDISLSGEDTGVPNEQSGELSATLTTAAVPLLAGTNTFSVSLEIHSEMSQARGWDGVSSSTVDFSDPLLLPAILVYDANGNLIQDPDLVFGSGLTYPTSLSPEPGTPVLFGSGMLGLLIWWRRRQLLRTQVSEP